MSQTSAMTINLPEGTKSKLERLSRDRSSSASALAAQAVTDFVDREVEVIEGIMKGLDDVANGRTVPHEQAMVELRAVIEDARRKRRM